MNAHRPWPVLVLALACSSSPPSATTPDAMAPADGAASPDVLAPDGAPAEAGPPAPDVRPAEDTTPPGAARSFMVQGKLTLTPSGNPGYPPPDKHDFLLRVDPTGPTILIGGPGTAASAPARTADRITFEATTPLRVSVPSSVGCGPPVITYEKLTVTLRGDRVDGTGQGKMMMIVGDQIFSFEAILAFSGALDDVPPTLGSDLTNVDPLGELILQASEPLPAGLTARLVGPPGGPVPEVVLEPIMPMGTPTAITGFRKPPATALVHGVTYAVALVGPRTDLAGNTLTPASQRIGTRSVPLLAASNLGFEESAATFGEAAVVDATFLPPIAGQRSLFLGPSAFNGILPPAPPVPWQKRFTARMATPATATKVIFKARPISSDNSGFTGRAWMLAAPAGGGAITSREHVEWRGPPIRQEVPGISGGALFLGQVRDIEVPLPASHGPEVVLDVSLGFSGAGCGLIPPSLGLLIDDLRVE